MALRAKLYSTLVSVTLALPCASVQAAPAQTPSAPPPAAATPPDAAVAEGHAADEIAEEAPVPEANKEATEKATAPAPPSPNEAVGAPAESPAGAEPPAGVEPPAAEPEPAQGETDPDALPPLTRLQRAGWWTLFSAFTVGTLAGVFGGLAQQQENKAVELATAFNLDTAAQNVFADKKSEWDRIHRRGRAFEGTAIGFATVAGALAIASVSLFIVDAVRTRRNKHQAKDSAAKGPRIHVSPAALEVHF